MSDAGVNAVLPTVSVVVPVYNSELSLDALADRLSAVLPTVASHYELVLVNDASRDASWGRIEALGRRYPWVVGIDLMRNYGQHNALLCGIRAARYEIIVTMDDDLQHPPEALPELLDRLGEGFDVVYAPPRHEQHGVLRDLASVVTKLALRGAMGVENARNVSAFRAFRAEAREGFARYRGPFVSIDVLLSWGAGRFASVAVEHQPRTLGISNYTVGKLVRHALNMMTGFTVRPLQLASLMGFAFALFGLLIFVYVVLRFLVQGGSVPGFPFLASIIAIFAGAQLLALGIIGEYLARIHFRTMDRPPYVERTSRVGDRDRD